MSEETEPEPEGEGQTPEDPPEAAGNEKTETAEDTGSGGDSELDINRLFRNEGLISHVDLRVEVAREWRRTVVGDSNIKLQEVNSHIRGGLVEMRGSRDRTVGGNYERRVGSDEVFAVGASIDERVEGGVTLNAESESDWIIGGAYVNTIVGPYLRLTAWADFMAWGGWLEVDTARVEIANLMIRAEFFYLHLAGARITCAYGLMDDFVNRIENFGVAAEAHGVDLTASMPGGGMTIEL